MQAESCTPGSFSATGLPPCQKCPLGFFAPAYGNLQCAECPRGSYSTALGTQQCTACPAGMTTGFPGAKGYDQCLIPAPCYPGYISQTGFVPCSACPKNTFSPEIASQQCTRCPAKYFTLKEATSGKYPDSCINGIDMDLAWERIRSVGTKLMMTVRWRIAEEEAHVDDMIGIFKGKPFTSLRQLIWAYTRYEFVMMKV